MKLNKYGIFLSLLIILTYGLLALDTIKYPGFISNHFFVDAKVFSGVAVTFLLFVSVKSKLLDFVLNINKVFLILFSVVFIVFSFLEGSHYENYVLSTYHFQLKGLVFLVLFSLSLFLVSKARRLTQVIKGNIGYIVLTFLAAYTLLANFGTTFQKAFTGDFYVASHLSDSYDQKMYSQWGDFYKYMVFVKNNTPENASIIIPPQIAPWWTRSGNFFLVRPFLYPRKLIQYETAEIPDLKSIPPGTHIMITWGEWECDAKGCGGWPIQTINAKEVIFKDADFGVKQIRQNFRYDPKDTDNPFGLLEI